MESDIYLKTIISIIAIFLGVIAYKTQPNSEANAPIEMIVGGGKGADRSIHMWHLKNGKIRFCDLSNPDLKILMRCYNWYTK